MDSIKDQMQRVRQFGMEHGISKLTEARWEADEVDGWEMTAIAAKTLKAKGAYRSPKDDGFTFMVFTTGIDEEFSQMPPVEEEDLSQDPPGPGGLLSCPSSSGAGAFRRRLFPPAPRPECAAAA